MQFYIVDVFAEAPYTGNQLAVICGNPCEATMLRLAQEMNYSETSFITDVSAQDGSYPTRIFTPQRELPFAGHPTLGTAFVIRQTMLAQAVDQVILEQAVGQIRVTFADDGVIWMQQPAPQFGTIFPPKKIAKILDILPDEIDTDFPIQEVSTGSPFILVPLKTLASVQRARVKLKHFQKLLNKTERILGAETLFIFCAETIEADSDIHARAFVHLHGIPEDAATGSANGCLAAWLATYNYFGDGDVRVTVEQGYEIGRPSRLYLDADETDDRIQVKVGGRVQMVAQGKLLLNEA